MSAPPKAVIARLSKARRFELAVSKVLDDGWSQIETANHYGVSRPRLNLKCQEERSRRDASEPTGSAEPEVHARRELAHLLDDFPAFDDYYWGNWICPDCEVHHERPDFHVEINDAITSLDRRVVINLPPYHAKSTLVTVKYVVWRIVRDPNIRVIIVGKSGPKAKTFLYSIKELLTNQELYEEGRNLIEDWGPFRDPDDRFQIWSTTQIYVAQRNSPEKDPTVQVLGVEGDIFGRRAELIVCDDVADHENQQNPDRVASMLSWLDKEVASRVGKRGKLVYVGTRVHAGDIYSYLIKRDGYRVLRYPAILSDEEHRVLWPVHMPYEYLSMLRSEMLDADWQLVYQNIDQPGLSASFTQEILDGSKNDLRLIREYDPHWRLIAGLDLAGGTRDSGYTAGVLLGVDLRTGKRYLIDLFNQKSMRAPLIKQKILEWSANYPIYEWRVENNAVQSQLVQYNEEIIRPLAAQGIRVVGHNTNSNKWDAQFGVESIAPVMSGGLFELPWGNGPTRQEVQPLIDQLLQFPMGAVNDLGMALWFADIGVRDILRRSHLPYFDERVTNRWPRRILKQRRVIDFFSGEIRPVPLSDQARPIMADHPGARGYRRLTVGRPVPHPDAIEADHPEPPGLVNVDPDTDFSRQSREGLVRGGR